MWGKSGAKAHWGADTENEMGGYMVELRSMSQ